MIAKEGIREISLATLLLGGLAALFSWLFWPLAILPTVVWLWVIAFFRDPPRRGTFAPGELCSPADGTVTEITELDHHESVGGPATRIGIFLSLFNVHINRTPCSGRIRSLYYRAGEFLDARHPESGKRNESNTVVIEPDAPIPGPIEVRQIAGLVARRIICHAKANDHLAMGQRFGLIKFGSRTELVVPRLPGTQVAVSIGDKMRAGLTVAVRQPIVTTAKAAAAQIASPRGEAPQPAVATGREG